MKTVVALLFLSLAINFSVSGQKTAPVTWKFELNKINNNDYKLVATASIDPTWAVYSQFTDPEGPVPTSFTVNGKQIKLKEESHLIEEMDKIFEVEVRTFMGKAIFTTIVHKGKNNTLKGTVEYMTCNGLVCIPPVTIPFELKF